MGTVVFLILRLSGLVDTKMDWIFLSFLISLDTIGIPSLVSMIKRK